MAKPIPSFVSILFYTLGFVLDHGIVMAFTPMADTKGIFHRISQSADIELFQGSVMYQAARTRFQSYASKTEPAEVLEQSDATPAKGNGTDIHPLRSTRKKLEQKINEIHNKVKNGENFTRTLNKEMNELYARDEMLMSFLF